MKVVLKKLQEKIKKYTDRNRKNTVEYEVGDKVLLSMKNLTWQIKKLVKKFVGL